MTLPLTAEICRQAYDYLNATPPFSKWNLPHGEDVVFKVVRDPKLRGWYMRDGKKHVIGISSTTIGRTESLMWTMAHEMIHLHEQHAGACGSGMHSKAFVRWSEQVCRVHGFDPKLF